MSADDRIRTLVDALTQHTEEAKPRERAELLVKLAVEYAYAGLTKSGLDVVRQALAIAGKHRLFDEEAEAYAAAALCHQYRGDYLSAIATALDAYRGFSITKNYRRMGHTLTTMSWACREIKAFDMAGTVSLSCFAIGEQTGDKFLQSRSANILGLTLCDVGRFEESQAQFDIARDLLIEMDQQEHVSRVTANMGNILQRKGEIALEAKDAELAKMYFRQASEMVRDSLVAASKDDNHYEISDKKNELAGYLFLLGEYDQALASAEEGRATAARLKGHRTVVEADTTIGKIFAARGDHATAERHFKAAIDQARQSEFRELQRAAHAQLAASYRAMNKIMDANAHDALATELKLAIDRTNQDAIREVERMWNEYFSQHPMLVGQTI
jgi:tetratricopeptide (TPR) repeat protein